MNIVIFTPALKASAIGRMTCLVSRELTRAGHLVTIIRSEDEGFLAEEPHVFGLDLIAWNDRNAVQSRVHSADTVVYQVGNSYSFHRGCMEWLQQHPGLVCLHDFYLGNLFYGWAQSQRPEAVEALQRWYGADAADEFFAASSRASFVEETCASSPMTEWLCAMAAGVITHSAWGIVRVTSSCAGPIYIVPLAYDALETTSGNGQRKAKESDIHLLTIGHVNPNKRVSSVVHAIAASALLKDRIVYDVVGSVQDEVRRELEELAVRLGVKLRIMGEVDSEALNDAFKGADIVCCLRWPSLEAASASAIEALLHGKAVIVTDTGFYSELPDDCVKKISPVDEISSLREALERLTQDGKLRRDMGARGRDWASTTFSAHTYAEQLIAASTSIARARPILDAISYFGELANSWGGMENGVPEMLQPLAIFQEPRPHMKLARESVLTSY